LSLGGGHVGAPIKSLTGNRIAKVDQALGKVFGFFSFTKAQAQCGLAAALFVHNPHGKVPTAIRDGFDIMDHVIVGANQIDFAQGKQTAALTTLFMKGKDNQEDISATFDPQ
jgi:hypothetical protein